MDWTRTLPSSDNRLGKRIRKLRESKGLSQQEVARRIGTTQSAIARIEAGGNSPRVDTLASLAAALEVDVATLVGSIRTGSTSTVAPAARYRGTDYEELVEIVWRQILSQSSIETLDLQRDVIIPGKSTFHQVDVMWRFTLAGIEYTTIVECKNWRRPVGQKELLAFRSVLDDLPLQPRGVYVTRSGYQKGAKEVARKHGILLYELRPPTEKDWEGKLRDIVITLRAVVPIISNISLEPDNTWIQEELRKRKIDKELVGRIQGYTSEIELVDSDGVKTSLLSDVLGSLVPQGFEAVAPTSQRHEFDRPTFVRTGDPALPLLKLKALGATVGLTTSEETVELKGDSVVGLILKDITGETVETFGHNFVRRRSV